MLTGTKLMFHPRFRIVYKQLAGVVGIGCFISYFAQHEWNKEAYAMRGQSNLFREDARKLKESGSKRELWR